jgi:hypothetical protein
MGRKFEIKESDIKNIQLDSTQMSIRGLGLKYSLNKNVIIRLLNKKKEYNNIESLTCKKSNKVFYDVNNKSGILTKHLKKYYDNVDLNNIEDYSKFFIIKYNNENCVSFNKFLIQLKIKHEKKLLFDGLTKYCFTNKKKYIFFIENNKISNNKKIKPILFFKLKNRYENSIFIYEDEWVYKKNIIEEKIKYVLNVSKHQKIYGRNCTISEISSNEKKIFLNKNHVQGTANSSIALGAFYSNKLVAVMTFLNHRNMTNDIIDFNYELNRFATDINFSVIGIGGKLFNSFLKRIEKNSTIISYGDRRFVLSSKNNFYRKINFTLNQISKHDFYYIKTNSINRLHKITMQIRHKKIKLDENEGDYYENMGYKKIWDCGKYRFIYKYE